MRRRARAALLASILALAFAQAARADGARERQFLRPTPASGTYGESFTFIADLDDGTYVHLTLALTTLGPGGLKTICRARIVPPGALPWAAATRLGSDAWSWAGGPGERLAVGPCSAEMEGEGLAVEVALEGGRARLAFAARPAQAPLLRDAVVVVPGKQFRSEVMLFRTPVTATVALPGRPVRTVEGAGYADHSRSTISPLDLFESWVRFRALRGDRPVALLGRRGRDGAFKPVWACEDGDHCRDLDRYEIRRAPDARPAAFAVTVGAGEDALQLRSGALLYRSAPVEELGLLGRLVKVVAGNPVTYVYRGTLQEGDAPPVEGILEVEVADD
ncbi:MAG TPA: hypothetical protein VFP65_19470 [Anaeromyxobacteraceae bacterium]|nr:hypothetical protein [Anaeromyxobacteraceae bacterium]